ncbi:MAG: hypothetical protein ACFHVJ_12005 [Aestuariibacter sp.]
MKNVKGMLPVKNWSFNPLKTQSSVSSAVHQAISFDSTLASDDFFSLRKIKSNITKSLYPLLVGGITLALGFQLSHFVTESPIGSESAPTLPLSITPEFVENAIESAHQAGSVQYVAPAKTENLQTLMSPWANVVNHEINWAEQTPLVNGFSANTFKTLSFDEGKVNIIMEPGAFAEPVNIHFTPVKENTNASQMPFKGAAGQITYQQGAHLIEFQLEATRKSDGSIVDSFEKPVRIAVDVRDFGFDLNKGGHFYLAYEDETQPGTWIEVPTTVHHETGLLSTETIHFSEWTTGWRPDSWTPQWQLPTPALFSGDASYSYQFDVPKGRNGMQPGVGISYSSGSLKGASRNAPQGVFGTGWSMSGTSITRTGVKMNGNGTGFIYPEQYRLTLNGAGYRMIESNVEGEGGRYYVEDMPSVYVSYNGIDGSWKVKTGDGTTYHLGTDEGASRTVHWFNYNGQGDSQKTATAWHIDTVTDVFGNRIQYNYVNPTEYLPTYETMGCGGICTMQVWTDEKRVSEIDYNFADSFYTDNASRVAFDYAPDGTGITVSTYHAGDMTQPIRQYDLVIEGAGIENFFGCTTNGTNRLTYTRKIKSITETGFYRQSDGTYLPATKNPINLDYETKYNYVKDGESCFEYQYLSTVDNGYGGVTTFDYGHDNRIVGSYSDNGGGDYPAAVYNYYVSRVSHDNGENSYSIDYHRKGVCYNQTDIQVPNRCAQKDAPLIGTLAGFEEVAVTREDFDGGLLTRKYTKFSISEDDDLALFGKPLMSLSGLPVEGVGNEYQVDQSNLVSVVNEYTTEIYANNNEYPVNTEDDVRFTYLHQTETKRYGGDPQNNDHLYNKVTYTYDILGQGGQQLGNLTRVNEYNDETATEPFKVASHYFVPNTDSSVWIVNKPASSGIYDGPVDISNLRTASWIYYDNQDLMQPPIKGIAGRTRQGIPCPTPGCSFDYQTIDTVMSHNWDNGNLNSTTTYNDYGHISFAADGTVSANQFPNDERQKTVVYYDSDYELYPVQVHDNVLNQNTFFEIYGFNDVPLDGYQSQTGLLKKVTNANEQEVIYEYDPFGRLYATYEQEEDRYDDPEAPNLYSWVDGEPLKRTLYWDSTWQGISTPFAITQETYPTYAPNDAPESSWQASTITYYDGFGKVFQNRTRLAEIDGVADKDTITTTSVSYNDDGKVVCTTLPFAVTTGDTMNTTTCDSQPHSLTQYDKLGLQTQITSPSGDITQFKRWLQEPTGYTGVYRIEQTIDANGHLKNMLYNHLDQLKFVEEYKDPTSEAYATTEYHYDNLGNLTNVTDAKGNNSNIKYNSWGHKVEMTDPDMGIWKYQYNAAGLMTRQEANNGSGTGNVLCLYYDDASRMLRKVADDTPSTACPDYAASPVNGEFHLASYEYYDNAAPAGSRGQVRKVSWGTDPDNNYDQFTYDHKGRSVKQTRVINGRSFTLETLSFDKANRPLVTRYPNGEIVTAEYDRGGQNKLTAGTDVLLTDVQLNAHGQMTLISRGNGVDTTFNYYTQSGAKGNNNFRLQSINHGANLPDFAYEYDKVGNIEKITSNGDIQHFRYDELNRLKSAWTTPGSVSDYVITYEYDEIGNIDRINRGSGWEDYVYSAFYQPHAVSSISGGGKSGSFNYDVHGNMTTRILDGKEYTQGFDVENRLIAVTNNSNGDQTVFQYDSTGQRTLTIEPNGTVTYFPFSGYQEIVRPLPPTINIASSTPFILPTDTVNLNWTSENSTSCSASGDWTGNKNLIGEESIVPQGSWSGNALTFTLKCTNESGLNTEATVAVAIGDLAITIDKQSISIFPFDPVTLTWNSTGMLSCDATGNWAGNKPLNGSEIIYPVGQWPTGILRFDLSCSHEATGNHSVSVTSTVLDPLPTPNALTAEYSATGVQLIWNQISGSNEPPGTTYNVYRSNTLPVQVAPANLVANSASTSYLDNRGTTGDYYVVTATNTYGESTPSNTAQAEDN